MSKKICLLQFLSPFCGFIFIFIIFSFDWPAKWRAGLLLHTVGKTSSPSSSCSLLCYPTFTLLLDLLIDSLSSGVCKSPLIEVPLSILPAVAFQVNMTSQCWKPTLSIWTTNLARSCTIHSNYIVIMLMHYPTFPLLAQCSQGGAEGSCMQWSMQLN